MAPFTDELLAVDRRHIDLRAGLIGTAVLSVFGVAIAWWGPMAIAAAVGALVLLVADPPARGRGWIAALLPLAVAGTVLTFVAVWIGMRPFAAAALVGLVGVVAALHAGRSRKAGIRGLVATLWLIIAFTLEPTLAEAFGYAAAFAGGALVGGAVAWLRARRDDDDDDDDDDEDDAAEAGVASPEGPGLRAQLRSPLGQFAVLRGLGLAVAVLLGFMIFPEHPAWVAITALIVMRPPTRQALVVGVQRSLGTGLGVVIAVLVSNVVGENTIGLVLLFLASAFLMMTFREVNYALFAVFVTTLVVYLQRILGDDASESGRDRFVETVLGVVIAFAVLGFAEALTRGRKVGT